MPTGTASAPTLRGRAGYATRLVARAQGQPAAAADDKLSRIHQQLDQLQHSMASGISVRGEAHRGLQPAAKTSTASTPPLFAVAPAAAPAAARPRTRTPTSLMWAGTQSFDEQARSRGVSRQ